MLAGGPSPPRPKGNSMKVVVVKSREEFNNLMIHLESTTKWKWYSGHSPTKWDGWAGRETGVGFYNEGNEHCGLCCSALDNFYNLYEQDVVSYEDFMPKPKPLNLNKNIIKAIEKLYE